jgi:ligand-binding SRPBCC domain-containing protein
MLNSKEIPVAGRTTGLIELGEFVEWEATHFFVRQRLSSKIVEMARPDFFVDVMVKGAFKSFWHRHEIRDHGTGEVMMIDDFRYEVPFGIVGQFVNFLFLNRYMENLLDIRGEHIKTALETGEWMKYLSIEVP